MVVGRKPAHDPGCKTGQALSRGRKSPKAFLLPPACVYGRAGRNYSRGNPWGATEWSQRWRYPAGSHPRHRAGLVPRRETDINHKNHPHLSKLVAS